MLSDIFPLRIAGLLLLFILPGAGAYANGHEALWKKANEYYQRKQYDSAISYYQKIAVAGSGPELFYNMGNAYYRLNDVGHAVLYYEKALRLDPGNKLIADNLLLAKKRVDNPVTEVPPIFFERWWRSLLHALNANGWAGMLLLLFSITMALIYLAARKKLRYGGRWIAFSATLSVIIAVVTFFSYRDAVNSGRAVITAASAPLLDRPQPGAKISATISAGTTVRLLHQKEGYLHIELPNGRRGWIEDGTLEKI